MTPYQAGEMFFSLRLHFSSSYDYLKYNGKTRLTPDKFALRADKFIFAKLARVYPDSQHFRDFVIAQCLVNPKVYSRDLMTPEAKERYLAYRKIHESLSYILSQDCTTLHDEYESLDDLLLVKHTYPLLLSFVWQERIHIETMLCMNRVLNFFPHWQRQINDTIKWPEMRQRYLKYDPFLNVEVAHVKQLLRRLWISQ